MEYLFEALLDSRNKNRRYVFWLLEDLYEHNLIQPKYQKKYNKFILFHPNFVESFEKIHRIHRIHNIHNMVDSPKAFNQYDEQSIANYFWEEMGKGNLFLVVDSLKYLNGCYAKNVIAQDKTSLTTHIYELFKIGSYDGRQILSNNLSERCFNEVKFFMDEGLSYTLEIPQIFLSVVNLIMKIDFHDQIDKLLECRFEPCIKFYDYMSLDSIAILADKACTSPKHFALLLISIIECLEGNTNFFFEHILLYFANKTNLFTTATKKFLISLWKALNDCVDYESFRTRMESWKIYDSCYDLIFEKNFRLYVEHSKGLHDEDIREYIANLDDTNNAS